MPDPALVGAAIRATPGVDEVQRFVVPRPEWQQPEDKEFSFSYSGGSNVHAVVQFRTWSKDKIEYSQYLTRMGRPPPRSWLDATQPVMLEVEKRIE